MRKFIGILVLFVGWIMLGMIGTGKLFTGWNFGKDAVEMERHVAQGAKAQIGETTYEITTSVSGRDIAVSGTVANDIEKAAVLANLDATHGRRTVTDNLKMIKTASPYIFRGSKTANGLIFNGNAPTQRTLADTINGHDSKVTLAGGMPDENWPAFVATGAQGISMLENGAFEIRDRTISVSGLARSLEEEAAVRAVFDNLQDGYTARVDLDVAPTVPYVFSGTKNADGETYRGYVASDAARGGFTGLIGDAAQGLIPTAGMPDENWPSVVGVGIQALKGLNDGELRVVDKRVSVTGSVNTPDAVQTIRDLFSAMPEGYSADVDLTAVDDGTPAALDFDWTAENGGNIDGKGPDGVSLDDLTAALNLPKLDGIFRQGKVAGKDAIMARFTGIGDTLSLFESAKASVRAESTVFEGVLLAGGDIDAAQAAMEDALGEGATITLTRSAMEPNEGDTRVNEVTGKNEIFVGGFWKVVPEPVAKVVEPEVVEPPKVEVVEAPVVTEQQRCTTLTAGITSSGKISYETASATLTQDSRVLLTQLAEVMKTCAGVDGLAVEIGGHTDSQGSEEFNLNLSQERASSVRNMLISVGISDSDIIARGYGESDPIATNDTEEGRAQNRRTTFTWIKK